jgi:hypothetical protein
MELAEDCVQWQTLTLVVKNIRVLLLKNWKQISLRLLMTANALFINCFQQLGCIKVTTFVISKSTDLSYKKVKLSLCLTN